MPDWDYEPLEKKVLSSIILTLASMFDPFLFLPQKLFPFTRAL